MCDRCHKPDDSSDIIITSGDGFFAEYCTNCISEMSIDPILIAPEGIFNSDISNVEKACRFETDDYEHYFTSEEAKRFYSLRLLPSEYKILTKRPEYIDEPLISNDFYTDGGLALQPLNKNSYVNDMKNYLVTAKLSKSEKKEIEKFLELFD